MKIYIYFVIPVNAGIQEIPMTIYIFCHSRECGNPRDSNEDIHLFCHSRKCGNPRDSNEDIHLFCHSRECGDPRDSNEDIHLFCHSREWQPCGNTGKRYFLGWGVGQ